jgi:hypothetical protein
MYASLIQRTHLHVSDGLGFNQTDSLNGLDLLKKFSLGLESLLFPWTKIIKRTVLQMMISKIL